VLWTSKDMLFRPRYGRIGMLALPYLWLFELIAPVIELGRDRNGLHWRRGSAC